jgi:hypothetical protein
MEAKSREFREQGGEIYVAQGAGHQEAGPERPVPATADSR